jgi:hypothetical protein
MRGVTTGRAHRAARVESDARHLVADERATSPALVGIDPVHDRGAKRRTADESGQVGCHRVSSLSGVLRSAGHRRGP